MSDFRPDVTSKYLCDEVSGQLIDSVGSHDSDLNNVLSFNGDSVSYDGGGDSTEFDFGNTPFTPNLDFTGSMEVVIDDQFDTRYEYFLASSLITDTRGPLLRFNGTGGSRQMEMLSHGSEGFALPIVPIGRLFNIGERVAIAFSYNHTTKVLALAVETDAGFSGSDSAAGTTALLWTTPSQIRIARKHQANDYAQFTLNEMNFIDGTARSIGDLEDTVAAIIGGAPAETNGIRNRSSFLKGLRR